MDSQQVCLDSLEDLLDVMAVGNPTMQRMLSERRAALGLPVRDPEESDPNRQQPSNPTNYFEDMGSSDTQPEMEPRKWIVCGLSARGIISPLSEEDREDDVAPLPHEDIVEVVDISDEEEEDMVELSS
ncbi:hypothetical protein Bca52824_048947 [Brassica carinata]|uniref:Uncharacterized protein n=1 Tax=Brassica carinata TaxID=52824 RepID=A0A8X7RHL1_BRACI|nr:hypothetical protein Bca52824_048947 [Brassica carinata]